MVGRLKNADRTRETHMRLRNIDAFESHIKAFDQSYEPEDAISNGYFYMINTLQFNLVDKSQYGIGCDFKHEINENRSNNCFMPIKG